MKNTIPFLLVLSLSVLGCDDDTPGTDAGARVDSGSSGVDGGTTRTDAGTPRDAGTTPTDAGTTPTDAGTTPTDAGTTPSDAGPPASDAMVGTPCEFNRDCASSQRCDCAGLGCVCQTGVRGTGVIGATCTEASDCAGGQCTDVNSTTLYCTDGCTTSDDCSGIATLCEERAFLGRACIVPE